MHVRESKKNEKKKKGNDGAWAKTNNLIKASIKNCKTSEERHEDTAVKRKFSTLALQFLPKNIRSGEPNGPANKVLDPPFRAPPSPLPAGRTANNDDSFLMCAPQALVITQETWSWDLGAGSWDLWAGSPEKPKSFCIQRIDHTKCCQYD